MQDGTTWHSSWNGMALMPKWGSNGHRKRREFADYAIENSII
jgi:hypothetical protein